MATLTCTKDYEKVDYLLNNNKVYAISLLYEVGVDDANLIPYMELIKQCKFLIIQLKVFHLV